MTVSRFSRQNDAGLRALNIALWENLVVVLVLRSKGPYRKMLGLANNVGLRWLIIKWMLLINDNDSTTDDDQEDDTEDPYLASGIVISVWHNSEATENTTTTTHSPVVLSPEGIKAELTLWRQPHLLPWHFITFTWTIIIRTVHVLEEKIQSEKRNVIAI